MAAGTVDSLIYDILVGKDTMTPALKKLEVTSTSATRKIRSSSDVLSDSMKKVTTALKQAEEVGRLKTLGLNTAKLETQLGRVGKQAKLTGKQIQEAMKRGSASARQFDMRMLSLLFGGMALQRAFGGFLRNVVNTFNKAEDNTSGLAQATTRLSAAWEFFKFSLFDALNTPFFIGMIDGIVSVIDNFSQMSRTAKISILAITGGLALLGTGLSIIGQIGLGWASIFGMGGFLNSTNTIGSTLFGSKGLFTKIRKFALAGLAIKALFDIDAFLKGETELREAITAVGDTMALVGLVSGHPWVIAFGLLPRLLPISTKISELADKLTKRGGTKFTESFGSVNEQGEFERPGALSSLFGKVTGGLEVGAGLVLKGVGSLGESMNNYIDNVAAGGKITDDFVARIDGNFIPSVENFANSLDTGEDSLTNSLGNVSDEMDVLTTDKTTEWIGASQERITQTELEIEANRRLQESQSNLVGDFSTSVDNLRNTSSATD